MDELELRIAALELWAIEVGAWLDPLALADAERSIRAGLEAEIAGDERVIRLQALQYIDDARKRFKGPLIGAAFKR